MSEKEALCQDCATRGTCTKPCQPVKEILWDGNRVMERHHADRIVCYPQRNEVHFSELENTDPEDLSDIFPWESADCRLTQTAVFIERFFNKTPCKAVAEQFGVKENTIICMYRNAVKQVNTIIEHLDARREGLKAAKSYGFTDDQKFFLLCCVFGFSAVEVARMFGRDRKQLHRTVKRMADRYKAAFADNATA